MSFTGKSDWVSGSLWNGEYFLPLSASVLVGTGLSASTTADGKITITNTGQSFDSNATYITLGPTGSLANERVLTAGPGIFITDYGANNAVAVSASLLAGPGITINQVSNSFAISSSAVVTGTWIEGSPSPRIRTSASVAIGSGTGFAQDFGTDVFFYVSGAKGTTSGKSVFGGDVTVSGNLVTSGGLTGSLQRTLDGSAYIIGGTNITTATASNGQITISVNSTGLNADTLDAIDSTGFVQTGSLTQTKSGIMTFSSGLTGSIQKTAAGVSYIVGGANITTATASNGQITIAVDTTGLNADTLDTIDSTGFVQTGSLTQTKSGIMTFSSGLTGSIQQTAGGVAYIVGGTNITTTTASNGQITIGVSGVAPSSATYLTLTTDGTLTGERTITMGTGLTASDAGANGAYTISVNPAALSITGTWVESATSPRLRTTASVAIGTGTNFAQDIGTNVFFYVSGSKWMPNNSVLARYSVLNDTQISGNLIQGTTNLITGVLPVTNLDSAIIGSTNATITANNGKNLVIFGSTGSLINSSGSSANQMVVIGSSGSIITQSINAGNSIYSSIDSTVSASKYSSIIASNTSTIINSSSNNIIIGGTTNTINKGTSLNSIFSSVGSQILNTDLEDTGVGGSNSNSIYSGYLTQINNNITDGLASSNNTTLVSFFNVNSTALDNNGMQVGQVTIIGANNAIMAVSGTTQIPSITNNIFRLAVLGGVGNTYGPTGFIDAFTVGGSSNTLGGGISNGGLVGGFTNSLLSHNGIETKYSILLGGSNNILNTSDAAALLAGTANGLSGSSTNSVIVGGGTNNISGSVSSIINAGGNNVLRTSLRTAIVGGDTNLITASTSSLILGGSNNKITSTTNGAILGGSTNNLTANNSILIGTGLTSSLANSVYLGGTNNTLVLSATLGVKISGSHYEHISTFKTTAYTASLSDYIIPIDTAGAGASVTVVLPASIVERGRILVIKDVGGSANTKNIIISSSFGKIDNSTNYTISANYGAATLVCFSITAGGNTWGLM